jgi:hypothetical protein
MRASPPIHSPRPIYSSKVGLSEVIGSLDERIGDHALTEIRIGNQKSAPSQPSDRVLVGSFVTLSPTRDAASTRRLRVNDTGPLA